MYDLKGTLKRLTERWHEANVGIIGMNELEYEAEELLGVDGARVLFSNISNGTKLTSEDYLNIKNSYFKAQNEQFEDSVTIGEDDLYFELFDDTEIKDMVKGQIDEGLAETVMNVESVMVNLLRGTTTNQYEKDGKVIDVKGTQLEERQKDLRTLMQFYVKNGYNMYPLMRKINREYARYKADEDKLDASSKRAMAMCLDSNNILQGMESVSPYKSIFNIAENLGELINEEKRLEAEGKDDKVEEIQQRIEKHKELLLDKSAGFDLDELTRVIADKQEALREQENGIQQVKSGISIDSIHYDMFTGLMEAKKEIHFASKRQQKQMEV